MRSKLLFTALIAFALLAPSAASAAKSCVTVYQECLNNSYDTSGFTRILADIECAARYTGCVRAAII